MKPGQIVKELEAAAGRLGVRVRYEAGNFRGGRCLVGEEELIMLNKRHPVEVHLAILANSLRDLPVDTLFLKPAVRAALEEVWSLHQQETGRSDVE